MPRLLGRRATDPAPARVKPPMTVLRADGRRIDLTKRDAGRYLAATKAKWQQEAFAYRDLIGELRYAVKLLARSVARVNFFVAEERPYPSDPNPIEESSDIKLDRQLAADAVANFDLIPFDDHPEGFTARLTENLSLVGEAYVHIDTDGKFHVRSVSEVNTTPDGRVAISTVPNAGHGQLRQIDPDSEDLLRLWIPHPEWCELADSPMRTLLDVCEDIVLAGREQRAAARSRVAANGILVVPASVEMMRVREDEDGDEIANSSFMADFIASMTAPIQDEGDAQAVVPIVLKLAPEDVDKVKHIRLDRDDSSKLIERQQTSILRLLKGLDIQPEQVEGIGDANHWSAWLIEARSIKHQIEPMAKTLAACLTNAFLRPALLQLGHDPSEVAKVTIGVDISPLAANPNRGQDARDAHDRGVISDASLRRELGFDDDDAPDDDELLRRAALSGRLPVDAAAMLLGAPRGQRQRPITVQGETVSDSTGQLPPAEQGSDRPVAEEGQVTPNRPVPEPPRITDTPQQPTQEPPPSVTAAATGDEPDPFVVDVETARRLADIDAALAERITIAADATLRRVLERAGARVRSRVQRDRQLAAQLVGVDAHLVPSLLGREQVERFISVSDLLGDGYGWLRDQFLRWMTEAARQIADVVIDLLRIPRRSQRARQVHDAVVTRLTSRLDQAWQVLAEHLDQAVERAMFREDPFAPEPGPGEPVDTLITPREVEDALRVAGGGAPLDQRVSSHTRAPLRSETPGPGGFGTGPDVTALLQEQGGVLLGWEWQYRYEIPRSRPFAPWHTELDGVRFRTFADPKLDTTPETAWIGPFFYPGDHAGCRCRVVPIIAVPEDDDGIIAQRLREAAGDPRNILAAEVAAEDTAAGRVGTSLQMEVEVRDRITEAIERLRREHIEGAGS